MSAPDVERPDHPMVCPYCDRGYPSGDQLLTHIVDGHGLLDRVVAGDLPDAAVEAIREDVQGEVAPA